MHNYEVSINSRWRTTAILEIVISPHFGEKLYDFEYLA